MLNTSLISIKLIWVVGFLFSFIFFFIYAGFNLKDFLRFDTITSLQFDDEDYLIFPAVTLCLINRNNNSQLFEKSMISCYYDYKKCYITDFKEVEYSSIIRNDSFICSKFNGGERSLRTINKPGKENGLIITLIAPDETDIIHFIGDNQVHPVISEFNSYFPGAIYFNNLEKQIIKRLPSPYNSCLKEHQYQSDDSIYIRKILDQNQTYRSVNCMDLCSREMRKEKGYCRSQCPYECDSIDFINNERSCDTKNVRSEDLLAIQKSKIRGDFVTMSLDELRNKLTVINIYFKKISCTKSSQIAKIPLPVLISNLGGLSGLFLELSFVSGYRLFQFLTEILFI